MDVFSFVSSTDIAEHCRNLNYVFSPVEIAYLIWRSDKKTLNTSYPMLFNEHIDECADDFYITYKTPDGK